MRIAFITYEYPPRLLGGAGVYAENLVEGLAQLGHDVRVYTPHVGADVLIEHPREHVEIRRLPQSREGFRGWFAFGRTAVREIERLRGGEGFDVAHVNGLGFFALRDKARGPAYVSTGHHLSVETAKKAGLSLADRVHDLKGENGFIVPLIERFGVRFPDRLLAVSGETKDGLERLFRVPAENVDVVWNGVDAKAAPSGPQDREELRRELGLPEGPLILFVGRVDDPRKELPLLLRALAALPSELGAKVVVVGSGSPAKATELAEGLGLGGRLLFMGKLSPRDLWSAYLVADVHVCASRQEGFGLTIAEALCAGCPVISTKVGVASELEGRLEGVVPPGDVEALRKAISSFVEKRGRRPSRVEVLVPYEFSWQRCAEETVSTYQKAIAGRRDRHKK